MVRSLLFWGHSGRGPGHLLVRLSFLWFFNCRSTFSSLFCDDNIIALSPVVRFNFFFKSTLDDPKFLHLIHLLLIQEELLSLEDQSALLVFWRCQPLILCLCLFVCFTWNHTLAQPITVKDDRSNNSNDHPVSLPSSVNKVFESLLNSFSILHLSSLWSPGWIS